MYDETRSDPTEDVGRIIEAAERLGIELNQADAIQWLTAISAATAGGDVAVDARAGVFGHRVSMLDFDPQDLAHFRSLGQLVEIEDRPGVVETALALSGSAAQSKIQSYPGDADYFERVNIIADTREQACEILADLMREKALDKAQGPTYQLIEVKFGSFPMEMVIGERRFQAGSPISWELADIRQGFKQGFRPNGSPAEVTWEQAAADPGWCKLDWVVADPIRRTLANASNVLDVTWQAPDGEITPLDGYLDPYFQEVYLQAESIPLFSKLVKHVSSDALAEYVSQLEGEITKYLTKDVNYGKAAKRMYNVFRLTGRYLEAAYVRELFDEPATMLYQVWSLVRTIDDVLGGKRDIPLDVLLGQAEELVVAVVDVLEGPEETEIVRQLMRLRDAIGRDARSEDWAQRVDVVRGELINMVNNFFYERLVAQPEVKAYMAGFSSET
jgi:hypothetical protein